MKEKGSIHLLVPIALIAITAVLVTSNFTISPDGQVQGVSIAKATNGNGNRENNGSDRSNANEEKSQNGRSEEVKNSQGSGNGNSEISDQENRNNKPTTTTNLIRRQEEQKESTSEAETETEDEESSASGEDLKDVRNISNFPLRIDPATGQLIMTKGGVDRVLTVLPAKAVLNMLLAHLKTGVGPKFFGEATLSATLAGIPSASQSASASGVVVNEDQIALQQINGQPVYRIPAQKLLKVFGFIPITTDFTSFVSAETGQVIREDESLLARILDFLSP